MLHKPDSALIIVGHGSTLNPDSSAPTWDMAEEIARRGVFGEVHCAFWKEEPSLRQVLHSVDREDVYVVPNFISEGYFTQTVIPRELGIREESETVLRDEVTFVEGIAVEERLETISFETNIANSAACEVGRHWLKYCKPVGSHPRMTELLLKRAASVAPSVPPKETSLFIVGHGTGLNDNSAVAAKREVAAIAARGIYGEVLAAYMEETPLISEWDKLSTMPNVVVVPFFIADGLHSYEDIPVLLGIAEQSPGAASVGKNSVFVGNPYRLRGRTLFYANSIGTEPGFADSILDQVKLFNAVESVTRSDFARNCHAAFEEWTSAFPPTLAAWKRMAEYSMRADTEGFLRSVESEETRLKAHLRHFSRTVRMVPEAGAELAEKLDQIGTKVSQAELNRTLDAGQMLAKLQSFVGAIELPNASTSKPNLSRDSTARLADWLNGGGHTIGEIVVRRLEDGAWEIRHRDDTDRDGLQEFTRWDDARAISNLDADGAFRPLKTAPTLKSGWRLILPEVAALKQAIEYFYPAMVGVWLAQQDRELVPVHLRETLERQSGLYRVTRKISDAQAQEVIAATCNDGACLKTILWRIAENQPVTSLPEAKFQPASGTALPLLCHEGCNFLVAAARKKLRGA